MEHAIIFENKTIDMGVHNEGKLSKVVSYQHDHYQQIWKERQELISILPRKKME
jgi:hypothetical protein